MGNGKKRTRRRSRRISGPLSNLAYRPDTLTTRIPKHRHPLPLFFNSLRPESLPVYVSAAADSSTNGSRTSVYVYLNRQVCVCTVGEREEKEGGEGEKERSVGEGYERYVRYHERM